MNQITQTAPTKEEAINIALEKLGLPMQDVSITVVEEGKKGFLGFGVKPAVVQVTVLKREIVEEVPKKEKVEIEQPQQVHDIEVNMPIVEDEAPIKNKQMN